MQHSDLARARGQSYPVLLEFILTIWDRSQYECPDGGGMLVP